MGANDKVAATFHPAEDMEPDALVGENPCIPPFMDRAMALAGPNARSAAAAVFDAIAGVDDRVKHAHNLQAAIDEIRRFIDGRHTVGAVEIRNLLNRHGI